MEAELLREMIADRDARIGRITRKSAEQNDRDERLRAMLEEVQKQSQLQALQHEQEKKDVKDAHTAKVKDLKLVQAMFQQQAQSLYTYAASSQPKDRAASDPSYVMRMQAQLCKAMHSMGICDHQMELIAAHSEALAKFHRDLITKQLEEKTQVELELMNDLMIQDNERRSMEANWKKQMDDIRKERDTIEKQLEDNKDDSDEDDDEENDEDDEDEEEKEAKEELMNLLRERNDEIMRLRKESLARQNNIKELEAQLRDLGADVTPSKRLVKEKKATRRRTDDDDEDDEDDDEEDDEDDEDDEDETETEFDEMDGDIHAALSRRTRDLDITTNVGSDDDDEDEDDDITETDNQDVDEEDNNSHNSNGQDESNSSDIRNNNDTIKDGEHDEEEKKE